MSPQDRRSGFELRATFRDFLLLLSLLGLGGHSYYAYNVNSDIEKELTEIRRQHVQCLQDMAALRVEVERMKTGRAKKGE